MTSPCGLRLGRNLKARLAEQYPDQAEYHSSLGVTLHNQGLILHRLGRKEEARTSVREAAARQRLALDRAPQDLRYRRRLSADYAGLATVAREVGRPDEVAEVTQKRLGLWPKNATELYAAARDCAPAAAGKDRPEERRHCAELAVEGLRLAVAAGFRRRGAGPHRYRSGTAPAAAGFPRSARQDGTPRP